MLWITGHFLITVYNYMYRYSPNAHQKLLHAFRDDGSGRVCCNLDIFVNGVLPVLRYWFPG